MGLVLVPHSLNSVYSSFCNPCVVIWYFNHEGNGHQICMEDRGVIGEIFVKHAHQGRGWVKLPSCTATHSSRGDAVHMMHAAGNARLSGSPQPASPLSCHFCTSCLCKAGMQRCHSDHNTLQIVMIRKEEHWKWRSLKSCAHIWTGKQRRNRSPYSSAYTCTQYREKYNKTKI